MVFGVNTSRDWMNMDGFFIQPNSTDDDDVVDVRFTEAGFTEKDLFPHGILLKLVRRRGNMMITRKTVASPFQCLWTNHHTRHTRKQK